METHAAIVLVARIFEDGSNDRGQLLIVDGGVWRVIEELAYLDAIQHRVEQLDESIPLLGYEELLSNRVKSYLVDALVPVGRENGLATHLLESAWTAQTRIGDRVERRDRVGRVDLLLLQCGRQRRVGELCRLLAYARISEFGLVIAYANLAVTAWRIKAWIVLYRTTAQQKMSINSILKYKRDDKEIQQQTFL